MNTYLYNLARDILLTEKNGISKVRFAKMLYFVHKGLVQKGQVASDALEFIRMPLGPVPVGFLELHTRPDIATYETSNGGLVYNTQMYTLRNQNIQPSEYVDTIVEILAQLRPFATSQLVEISHKEPSWQQKGMEKNISLLMLI